LPNGSFAFRQNAHPFSRFRQSSPFASPYTSLPFPFFGDSFNPDDIYSTGYPVASQPPVFLLQAASALAGSPDSMSRNWAPDMGPDNSRESAQPLMIELQNGRYVRVNNTAADGDAHELTLAPENAQPGNNQTDDARPNNAQPAKSTHRNSTRLATPNSTTPSPTIASASPMHDLPPAVLVFRDGHSEEVRDYTIADGILYARGDYYTDGYWNKKIELSSLNLAQTLQGNTTRNVKFVLPSSPNEVITRP
jgi:hypothetical protein